MELHAAPFSQIRPVKQKSCLSFVGLKAPMGHLSSAVVCTGGPTGEWSPCLGLTCHLLACAPESLDVLQALSYNCRVDQEGPFASPLPGPARLKVTSVFKFSSCNSPEQGQHCPHVLLILCLVCVSLSLRKCVIRGRGLYLPSDPWQSCWVQKVAS